MNHVPVLLQEVLEYLDVKSGDVIVDCTFGFGGHSREFLKKIGNKGRLIGIEKDAEVISKLGDEFKEKNFEIVSGDFRNLQENLEKLNIRSVDKILFDLGISSFHFDSSKRGFTFSKDEPLDMRIDSRLGATAADLVNSLSKDELADLFYHLADEGESRIIAKAIFDARRKNRITTTLELVSIVSRAKRGREKINPATKVFQALRIAVNDELKAISEALPQAINLLNRNGRIAVISFHSGEDRIVKNIFKEFQQLGKINILTKKPLQASGSEIIANPRSRSAKLRAAERI